jgi:hypothetical protein
VTNTSRDWYLTWDASNIEFYPLDSCDNFLEFNISKTFNGELEFMPSNRTGFANHEPHVIFTLAIKPINVKETKWACI